MIKWCDYHCEYASFAKDEAIDGSGSCQTFQGIWCKKLKQYVFKNAPCAAEKKSKKDQS